jgi:hypothetical protein
MMGLGALLSQKAKKQVRKDDPTASHVQIFRGRGKVMTNTLAKKSTERKLVLQMTCMLIFSSL